MKTIYMAQSAALLFLCLLFHCAVFAQRYPAALSPEESLKKLNVVKGFKVQIYASEPHVFDPVALEFDELGNAYVVEMPDYPFEAEPGKGKGRIRILKDTDGDGRIDKSIIYAENLTEATSILPWKGGLIVTAAPNILYLKDTDGDGKSDIREVLFSGFFQNNSEAQVTSLRLGIDNWIYANNRGQAGMVIYSKTPGVPPMDVRGADFRFRLDRDQYELETGPGQFGQTIDDWGRRFFTDNSIHLLQSVIPWRYVHRHPYLQSTRFSASITDHEEDMFQETEAPYWRVERSKERNRRFQEAKVNRYEYVEDHFTGASGGTIYNGETFPKEYHGNIFTTDVSGNLVHRDILVPSVKSPLFIAKRGNNEKTREFMYSTDPWFRPVIFTVGPDGYLYVIDYYRQHIETPVSISDELKADMDFMAGSDMGRIYRVLPENAGVKNVKIDLKNASNSRLIGLLAHPNAWWRSQAQRLLLERQDKSVIPAVKAFLEKSQDARARLHALYVLEGFNSLNAQVISKALQDPAEGVRENAVILAERFPELLPKLIQMSNDPSTRVAFQAVLSLGEFKGKEIIPALAKALEKYGPDQWFRTAVLSSDQGSSIELLKAVSQQNSFFQNEEPWKLSFIDDLSYIIGARNSKEQMSEYLGMLSQSSMTNGNWQLTAIKGLVKGLSKTRGSTEQLKEVLKNIKTDSAEARILALADLKKLY